MNRNHYLVFVLAPLIAAGVIGSVSGAQPRSLTTLDERLAGYPELTVRLTDERIEAPATVDTGMTLLVQENLTEHPGHSFVMRIPDDVTEGVVSEALGGESLVEVTPEWFWRSEFLGNGDRAALDRPAIALVDLKPGRYVVGDPYRAPSEFAQFDVVEPSAEAQQAPELPEPDITAELFEMGFHLPENVPAGPQLWEVKNTGAMLHEIAIFPVPAGATPADVEAAATAELQAEMSGDLTKARPAIDAMGGEWVGWTADLIAGVGVISPQRVSLAQIDLEPGTYGAVCYLPVPDTEQAHLMLGMTEVFTVESPSA
jgi:hypothetical protein